MTDTERLDKLEKYLKEMEGNGLAFMSLNHNTRVSIDDIGYEDGRHFYDQLGEGKTLRTVIDNLKEYKDVKRKD